MTKIPRVENSTFSGVFVIAGIAAEGATVK
jgi:hypothetical protein